MQVTKKEIKKLIVPFLLLFLISYLAINWEDISWLFNYRFIGSSISNVFDKDKVVQAKEPVKNSVNFHYFDYSEKDNSIEIRKIEVIAPIVFSESEKQADLEIALKNGVLFYPDSVLPGQRGEVVILGHSAPPGWPKINYDWIFNRLNELEPGDEIFVYLNNREYPYTVFETILLAPGQELPTSDSADFKSLLTLLTCWPPGKDFQRIAVRAELNITD